MKTWRRAAVPALLILLALVALAAVRAWADAAQPLAPRAGSPAAWRINLATSGGPAKTGDRATVTATVTNTSRQPLIGATLLLGLIDLTPGQPVPLGLETWTSDPESVALPPLAPGASSSATWHLVMIQHGPLGLYASVLPEAGGPVESSALTVLPIHDNRVLNPGHVLPVAFGEPVLLAGVLAVLKRQRARRAR